jgi:hypothetical protein
MKLRNKTIQSISMLAIMSGLAVMPNANASDAPTLEVSRVQGDLVCHISGNDGGEVDCTSDLKAQGKVEIALNSAGQDGSLVGVNEFSDLGGKNALVVVTDAAKNLKSVTFVRGQKFNDTVQLELSSTETASLNTIHISPMTIQCKDQDCTISMSYVAYGKEATGLSTLGHKELSGYLTQKVKPILSTLQSNQMSLQ